MRPLSVLALLLLGSPGCTKAEDPPPDCSDDRCTSAGSRADLLAALDGFHDPVATYLRTAATERGTLSGNYRNILDGVGDAVGCDASTERSFVVLSNLHFVPKPIVTRCSGDATAASQFMMAIIGDVDGLDPMIVHMAAWDADAGVYRRYATAPAAAGEMAVNVAPTFCLGCHGGPEKLATWVPIMNEMTSPWSGWNATPGFTSQLFDDHLPTQFVDDEVYRDVTRPGLLDSAASFEPVVRTATARVTGARLKRRASAPDLGLALELLRPLYCDESLNYVSEVHTSGELRSHALVDDAMRSLYRSLAVTSGWAWIADTRIQLVAPTAGEVPVTLIPVRGESTLGVELGLVARGALVALDALRVRALDWKHPVQSDFRCGLFRTAAERIAEGALDAAVAASGATTAEQLLPLVYDEIMTVSVGATQVPLRAGPGFELLAIPDASAAAAAAALAAGNLSGFDTTLVELGDAIEAHVSSFQADQMRTLLANERDRRACRAELLPTAPIFDVDCGTH